MVVVFPKPVVHGGCGKRQLEKTRKMVLDFSASTNPFLPKFTWHCDPELLRLYPDNSYHELKERIAKVFRRKPEEICVGNGSIELIRTFCSVIFRDTKTFYVESPTFGEYELSANLAGGTRAPASPADVDFYCNPNNPTGSLRNRAEMKTLLKRSSSGGGIMFCDEAFIELADPKASLVGLSSPDLFVLRSLTKSFAVPGIRFGYGFGDPDLVRKIEVARPPWSVNAYAEAFAMEALLHFDELAESRVALTRERAWLVAGIESLGLRCIPSAANYLVVVCGREVSGLCHSLARNGILVRDCTSFGTPDAFRTAVRTREENALLIEALSRCMQ